MVYTPQTWIDGSLSTPLSAARLTHIETGIDDADTRLTGLFINVATYGATGDGATDDTAAIQAALAAVPATGGLVYIPAGTYLISSSLTIPNKTHIHGAGMGATVLKKTASFAMLKFWGTATGPANHLTFAGARDLYLDGGNFTGTMIDMVYCTRLDFYNIHCVANPDITIDTVEVWDSRFYNVSCNLCGSTTNPAVRIGSSRAASGFGLSTDSSNQLMFFGLLIETWKAGAIKLNPGTGGVLLHQIYFFGMKIESTTVRGVAIDISGTTRDIHMDDVWVYMGAFDSGFSTAQNAISVHGDRNINIRGVFMSNSGVATIANGFDVFNAGSYIDQVYGNFTTAPTGALVAVTGGSNYTIGHAVIVGPGTLFTGDMTASPVMTRPVRSVAGTVSDASFLAPPLVGTSAIDVTNNRFYVKTAAATWHYTALPDSFPPLGQATPAAHGLTSWAFDPAICTGSQLLTNGTVYVVKMHVSNATTITKLYWQINAVATTPTAGQNEIGIYDSLGAKLASTNVDSVVLSTGLIVTTISSLALVPNTYYWVGMVFNAATAPTLGKGTSTGGGLVNAGLSGATLRFATAATAQTVLPSSFTPSALTAANIPLWAAIG